MLVTGGGAWDSLLASSSKRESSFPSVVGVQRCFLVPEVSSTVLRGEMER